MRIKKTLIALLALAMGCAPQGQEAEKSMEGSEESAGNYKIVYNVFFNEETDDYEIFVMNLDGSDKKNISNWEGVDWSYYAYGDKIYFISDRDTTHRMYYLYEMDVNGENVRQVSDVRLADSWMSSRGDGTEMIVKPHSTVDSVFHILDLTGGDSRRLDPGLVYMNDPAFSPDGSRIAFRGATQSFKRDVGFVDEIYLMNDDGTNLTKLTTYPAADTTAPWYAYKAGPPHWNAREDFISYQSLRENKYSLYAVTPDGKRNWKLLDTVLQEGWHAWSSDGNYLAVELFDPDETQFGIGLVDWRTRELTMLTDSTFVYQQAPVFIEVR